MKDLNMEKNDGDFDFDEGDLEANMGDEGMTNLDNALEY